VTLTETESLEYGGIDNSPLPVYNKSMEYYVSTVDGYKRLTLKEFREATNNKTITFKGEIHD
jgi:hypothetical protein